MLALAAVHISWGGKQAIGEAMKLIRDWVMALPNPVTVVDLSCTTVFIKKPNRLVIACDGWFFEAVRIKHVSAP